MGISPSIARKIIKKSDIILRPFDEQVSGGDYLGLSRWNAKDEQMVQALPPDFDPDNLPEGYTTRTDKVRDSKGVMRDVVRYLSPRSVKDYTLLAPYAEGSGWRTTRSAPTKPDFTDYEEGNPLNLSQEEKDTEMESYLERLKNFEDEVIPDLFDTADHEAGHAATQNHMRANMPYNQLTSGRNHVGRPPGVNLSDLQSKLMARELDDPDFARARMREPRKPFPNYFNNEDDRSAWHEMAAYTTEFPFNPAYAAAKWLHHRDVEQAERRAYLERVARAQKKWKGYESIDAKQMARDLSPKKKGGRNTRQLRRIMGVPPERRTDEPDWTPTPNPEADRLLLPPEERIYRNLRNAILYQAGGIGNESGMFATDPEGRTTEWRHGGKNHAGNQRRKMAERLGEEALSALDAHFDEVLAGNAPVPKTISDLPNNVKGEIGRLQLRRILAGQVGDQKNTFNQVQDWKDPDEGYIQDWVGKNKLKYPISFSIDNIHSDMNARANNLYKLGLISAEERDGLDAYTSRNNNTNFYVNRRDPPTPEEFETYSPYAKLYKHLFDVREAIEDKQRYGGKWSLDPHANEEVLAAIRQDYAEGHPWYFESKYKKPGPNYQAYIDMVNEEKAASQQSVDLYAQTLGIDDNIMSMNKPEVFPDKMLADYGGFTEFDPENNPEHAKALEFWNDRSRRGWIGHMDDESYSLLPRSVRNIENIFPSLQYGLIPTQALEYDEETNTYKTPTISRTYQGKNTEDHEGKPHQYDSMDVEEYDYGGYTQDPFGEKVGRYYRERLEEPTPEELISHPLAGKQISQYKNVDLLNPQSWKYLTDKGSAFKRNMRNHGSDTYGQTRAGVQRFGELDRVGFINRMAEKDGISFHEAYEKYFMEGHEDWHEGDMDSGFYFKRKGSERETPHRYRDRRKIEYDPVSRAIAQAFMDSDLERGIDEDSKGEERLTLQEKEREMNPAFGGEPHDSEFKPRKDRANDLWNLDSYVRQLEKPQSRDGNMENQRKNLTHILDEIANRRLEEAGYDSWDELRRELDRREEEKELEDED